jgi:alkylhydroperoxidase/carboxymuconolactone decarboxylase family protein YurZ
MKIYRNKLYSIQDATKRSGVTEEAIKEMITYHVIMANKTMFCDFIMGEDIPKLKAKWEEWKAKKGRTKKAKVTMLRMNKGD